MADNAYINKVIYGGNTLIDLTGDDALASHVLAGQKFHLPTGEPSIGTLPSYKAWSDDATVTAADILTGKAKYSERTLFKIVKGFTYNKLKELGEGHMSVLIVPSSIK